MSGCLHRQPIQSAGRLASLAKIAIAIAITATAACVPTGLAVASSIYVGVSTCPINPEPTHEFRLVGGSTPFEGRVEYRPFEAERWGAVCSHGFKENEAKSFSAVCNRIGFWGATGSYVTTTHGVVNASWQIEIRCSAADPESCNYTPQSTNCVHGGAVVVRCAPSPIYGEYRLVNVSLPTRGLVLFRPYPHMPWGTIRATNVFTSRTIAGNAMRGALCRSLGFDVETPFAAAPLEFGSAHPSSPTYVQYTSACTSPFLNNCSYGFLSAVQWPPEEQLGIYCDANFTVRLLGGYTPSSGQIQFRHTPTAPWMYFTFRALLLTPNAVPQNADVEFESHNTRALDAICRQAGFHDAQGAQFRFFGPRAVGGAVEPAQYSGIRCLTDDMMECTFTANANNSDLTPAGVDCYPAMTEKLPWEFRLWNTSAGVGGKVSKGIAQMRLGPDTPWGSIMDADASVNNFGLWDTFCNEVGYASGSTVISRFLTPFNGDSASWLSPTSTDFRPAYLSDVDCSSPKRQFDVAWNPRGQRLSDCRYSTLGSWVDPPSKAVVVDCDSTGTAFANSATFEVRVGGSTARGSIEFRPDSATPWGSVCTTNQNALVALCAMAGYGDSLYVAYQAPSAPPANANANDSAPVYLHGLSCPYDEKTLEKCDVAHFEAHTCAPGERAGANCYAIPNNTTQWEFQLVGLNAAAGKGRLEAKLTPLLEFGPICSASWGPYNALAVCKTLGFDVDTNIYAPTLIANDVGQFGSTTAKTVLASMFCSLTSISAGINGCNSYTIQNPATESCGVGNHVAIDCFALIPVTSPSVTEVTIIPATTAVPQFEFETSQPDSGNFPNVRRLVARVVGTSAWGTVRTSSTTAEILAAVCAKAGVAQGSLPPAPSTLGADSRPSSRTIKLDSCPTGATGPEDCQWDPNSYFVSSTVSVMDIVVDCAPSIYEDTTQWKLRLMDGATATTGRLELLPLTSGAEWGPICRDSFGADSVNAACNSLKFNHTTRMYKAGAGAVARPPSTVTLPTQASASATMWLDDFNCNNKEQLFPDCRTYLFSTPTNKRHNCGPSEAVAIECEHPIYYRRNFEFRFIRQFENITGLGRVEVRMDNIMAWGTISHTAAQTASALAVARAACLSAGFTSGLHYNFSTVFAALSSVPVHLKSYVCDPATVAGSRGLFDCEGFDFADSNSHSSDLTVQCDYADPQNKSLWEVKLADGEHVKPHFGRVMFRPAPWAQWGTINGASLVQTTAMAICRSAGYTVANGFKDPINAQFTTGLHPVAYDGPVYFHDLRSCATGGLMPSCTFDINKWRLNNDHKSDLWIDCYPAIEARLVGGSAPWRGRLEVKYNNWTKQWGTVCNDNFVSDKNAWRAACRSAGFENVTEPRYEENPQGTLPIFLDDVSCGDGAARLSDCDHRKLGDHNCNHNQDAGLNCYPDEAERWAYRLRGTGSTATKGRIEVLPTGTSLWGMVCPLGFNHSHAAWLVACRSAGFDTLRAAPARCFGAGFGPMLLANAKCGGAESALQDCEGTSTATGGCVSEEAAAVDCDPPAENRTEWEFALDTSTAVPLEGGNSSSSGGEVRGTLLVRFSPTEPFGAVCNNNPTQLLSPAKQTQLAEVVCRTLGFHNSSFPPRLLPTDPAVVSAPSWWPIVLSNITCFENGSVREGLNNLRQCTFNPPYDHSCDHSADIHVDCGPTHRRARRRCGRVTRRRVQVRRRRRRTALP